MNIFGETIIKERAVWISFLTYCAFQHANNVSAHKHIHAHAHTYYLPSRPPLESAGGSSWILRDRLPIRKKINKRDLRKHFSPCDFHPAAALSSSVGHSFPLHIDAKKKKFVLYIFMYIIYVYICRWRIH